VQVIVVTTRRHRLHSDHALALRRKTMQQRAANQCFTDRSVGAGYEKIHLGLVPLLPLSIAMAGRAGGEGYYGKSQFGKTYSGP